MPWGSSPKKIMFQVCTPIVPDKASTAPMTTLFSASENTGKNTKGTNPMTVAVSVACRLLPNRAGRLMLPFSSSKPLCCTSSMKLSTMACACCANAPNTTAERALTAKKAIIQPKWSRSSCSR